VSESEGEENVVQKGLCIVMALCLCIGIVAAGDWELRFTTNIGTNNPSQEYFVLGTDPDGRNYYIEGLDVAATPGNPGMWLEKNAGVRVISDYRLTLNTPNPALAVYTINGTNILAPVAFSFLNYPELPPIVGAVTVQYWNDSSTLIVRDIDEVNDSVVMGPDAFNSSLVPYLPNITAWYTLPPSPVADFTANVTHGEAPLTVQFTNTSTGYEPGTPTWNFGDGSGVVFNRETPVHTYASPGRYDVLLVIKSDGVVSNTTIKEDFITVLAPPPVVNMSANRTLGYGPLTVNFTDLSASGLPGYTTLGNREWDFGDGTPNVTGTNVTHTYTSYGIFNVTLTVTDSQPRSSTRIFADCITSLAPPPDAAFCVELTPPTGNVPVLANLSDASAAHGGFAIASWYWEFGDGTNYTGQTPPDHLYSAEGTYHVNLTVADTQVPAQTNTTTETITLPGPLPIPDFTASPTSGRMPVTVRFTDLSGGTNISAWAWDFDADGHVDSTEQNPSWMPAGPFPARYTVTLIVTDEVGSNIVTKANYLYINKEDDDDGPDYPPVTRPTPLPTVHGTDEPPAAGCREMLANVDAASAANADETGPVGGGAASRPSSSSPVVPGGTDADAESGAIDEHGLTQSPLGVFSAIAGGIAGWAWLRFRRW